MRHSWFQWLRAGAAPEKSRRTSKPRRSSLLQLLVLEDRTVLSTLTVLNNADSGAGSFRDTVAAAQSGDTIVFDPSLMHETITLTSGPLALSSNLAIDGLGADLLAINGNKQSQLFTLSGSAQVTLSHLTLTGGLSSQGGAVFIGGNASLTLASDVLSGNQAVNMHGLAQGGAVFNSAGASLTVENTLFANNQTNGATEGDGGGLANAGTLSIADSQFISNSAIASAPGALAFAGAVDNGQTMTISHCVFTGNSAVAGMGANAEGGAVNNSQTMTISDSLFTDNSAVGGAMPSGNPNTAANHGQGDGGAIYTGGGSAVILTLSNSIIADNEALGGSGGSTLVYARTGDGAAGGIINLGGGTLNVTGCTITGNKAIAGTTADGTGCPAIGGGIDNNSGCTLNLKDSTISSNLCQAGAGASGYAGGVATGAGIGNDRGSTATITNCTISMNVCLGGAGGAGSNGGDAAGAGIENGIYTFAYGLADASSLSVSNCALFGNMAQGGSAGSSAVGGDGLGAGLFAGAGTVMLDAVLVSGNQARGGVDSQGNTSGNGLGGGVYVDPSATATANAQTMMVGNHASKDNNDVFGTINIVP